MYNLTNLSCRNSYIPHRNFDNKFFYFFLIFGCQKNFIVYNSFRRSKGSQFTMNNSNLFNETEMAIKSRIKILNDTAVINSIHLAEFLNIDPIHLATQINQLLEGNALLFSLFTEEEQTEQPSYYLSLRSFAFLDFNFAIKKDIAFQFTILQEYMIQFEQQYKQKTTRKETK